MKNLLTLFVNFFFSSILLSQSFCIKAESSLTSPSLTHLSGNLTNGSVVIKNTFCPDIGVEYMNSSGITFSTTLGFQKEQFDFSEKSKVYIPPELRFNKTYKSFPFIISSGYTFRFRKFPFRVNALAGIGFGMVNSNEVKEQYAFDGSLTIIDQQGQPHTDTVHILYNVSDLSMKKILCQARLSVALEYDVNNFFVRAFFEARSWLSNFENIKYHSEHSSAFFQYAQTSDGNFSVRPGYAGVGIGLGWYFGSSKKVSEK